MPWSRFYRAYVAPTQGRALTFALAMREAIKSNTRITPTYFAQLIDKIYD